MVAGACAGQLPTSITAPVSPDHTVDNFTYCGGYGCGTRYTIRIDPEEWRQVRALFRPAAQDAGVERHRIAEAVALLETMVGQATGMDKDRGGSLPYIFQDGQLDCFSEATNTSIFLGLLERDGLLKFHVVRGPRLRGLGYGGTISPVVHATAVIEEIDNGEHYVVDSWFYDNGVPPVIAPLDDWLGGWSPADGAWI